MNPLVFFLIMMTMMLGTALVMTSSHWFMVWVGFEMNMLAIIPLLTKQHNPRSTEAATKYFLTQATASMLLMMATIMNLLYTGHWSIMKMTDPIVSILITVSMAMKLGLAPFHFWVPEVTQGIPLSSGLILLTWQKLAPLSILYMVTPLLSLNFLMTLSLLSIAIGGWGGLNQTQLRKILAYSSIAHMGWMISVLVYNPTMTLLNLFIYIPMTITTFMLLMMNSTTTTTSLSHMWNKMPLITMFVLITMLSLGGLPPLTGFLPKWLILQEMVKNENIFMSTLMALMALLSLYFYVRITYTTSLTLFPTMNNTKINWQFKMTKKTACLSPMIIVSTMILPMSPMLLILE
uniref:NADH dehydrogenase subunit 2 n=1 Tax=Histiotus macrotus TaxID=258919 RepID=UPI0022FD4E41|nr:NADH dehydrogenase subunit 2 [Histiotus macrotus]WAQ70498.1 NADH dehydrogenase subunit 2 [Histiotus macrotus]WAQ70511.1 NADH dehydrogenase subunit 2 [Histiotus macrotus]WAQ70524.1 NADH dehydrogenase subunit 2 [Histiotus macrotus]WAQ70628.1 NADH dehydrogenase subunit 2 [Histiotus macrotus]WAQ70667.1 NADH dehydrogenase subunit 2 [Histiotus macrotus]